MFWIIIGSDRQPETKQEIERKIVRFRSGRIADRRSESNTVHMELTMIYIKFHRKIKKSLKSGL